jgi:outer membrane protein assembly factor BamB
VGPDGLYLSSAGEKQQSIFGGGDNRAGLRALNTLGTLQWDWRGTVERSVASPALGDATAYLPSSDHSVYAIDLATQQPKWTFTTRNWVWATPLLAQDRVYVASMDHSLYAVDDADGALIWEFRGNPGALPAGPALSSSESSAPGLLFFGSLGGHVYAVRSEDGKLGWEAKVDHGVWASPRLVEDAEQGISALYVGTLKGTVYALDPRDGSELWKQEIPGEGEIRGTPAYVAGTESNAATLYVGHEDGRLYAFDARTGEQVPSPLGQQVQGASLFASPAFDGQHLYVVATSGEVFALDPQRNAVVWQTNPLERAREEE